MVAVAYRRKSFTRGSNCKALTGKVLVFWMSGRLREVVAHGGSTVYINMLSVSSDDSIQRRHWQPLSLHFLSAYCTHPTHDVNDVMCEGWLHHRCLRPLLFSNSGVGSFTSHKNQISVSAVRRDQRFFVLIRED